MGPHAQVCRGKKDNVPNIALSLVTLICVAVRGLSSCAFHYLALMKSECSFNGGRHNSEIECNFPLQSYAIFMINHGKFLQNGFGTVFGNGIQHLVCLETAVIN